MPANITPIQLPAYSPELNPIENLWHYLKSHHWSNRAYADQDELEDAVIQAWNHSVEKRTTHAVRLLHEYLPTAQFLIRMRIILTLER